MSFNKKSIIFCLILVLAFTVLGCEKKDTPEKTNPSDQEETGANVETPIATAEKSIMWEGNLYYVQDVNMISATKEQLGDKIGAVTELVGTDQEPTMDGASNTFEVGSTIYALDGDEVSKNIAIEYNEKYYIAQTK